MKYCEKCKICVDDTALCCEKCGGGLISTDEIADEKQRRKIIRRYKVSVGLVPNIMEYAAFGIVLVCAVIFLVIHFTYKSNSSEFNDVTLFMFVIDLLVCVAIIFKGWLFRHFSWQAFTAKAKGIKAEQLLPSKPYALAAKSCAVFWSVYNICYLVYTLWLIK